MLFNLAIFLRVASRYQYKTVARKREAPVHRRPQWLQPQVVDGIVIPVRHFAGIASQVAECQSGTPLHARSILLSHRISNLLGRCSSSAYHSAAHSVPSLGSKSTIAI